MNKATDNGADYSGDDDSSSEKSDKQLDGPAALLHVNHEKRVHEEEEEDNDDDADDEEDDSNHHDRHKETAVVIPAKGKGKKKANKRSKPAEDDDNSATFPQLLMEVLENESLGSVISWLPHGLAFAILDKKKFARDIMGRYLKQSKFTSFTRKLNRWGFERVAKGPETGSYYHPLFQRNNLQLCMKMMCQKHRDGKDKDGSVASGTEADGSTTSSPQPRSTSEELRKAQTKKLATAAIHQGIADRAQQAAALARQVEGRSNGHTAAAAAALAQDPNMIQMERMRQMLQMQLAASQGALDGHPQAGASAQRLMEASAVSAAHEARLQQHQQQQQQQQLQLEDFRQRLEQQAQADQASWAGLDQQNSESAMRHVQLLQQQRQQMANQGAAEAAALRQHYGLSEADVSALQLQHHLSSMRQDQGRAQMEQLEEARQRHMWRQQMELAQQQWSMQQQAAAAQQQAAAAAGGSQEGAQRENAQRESAQRQLQESLAAQTYLQQHHQLQQQQQQQQLLHAQQQQQLDPLTLQLIQQVMNGQFDPSTGASRGRFQG